MNNPQNSGPTPEELNAQATGAPKRGLFKKALIGGALILGAAALAGVLLFTSLLSRISKPGTTVFAEDIEEDDPEDEVQPQTTPAKAEPAPKPVLEPAASPDLTPEPEPLPLSELYPQSRLSQAQLEAIKAQNANIKEFVNVLVVGVDRRGSRGEANADVIIIASLDKRHGRLKLVSVLRDLYVPIEGYESGRINSAAAKGGMPLLLKTVNDALHTDISNYVLLDFYMFEKVIDELDGVTVRMSAEEISAANDNIAGLNKQRNVEYLWDGFIFAEPGNVRLNGKQALGYVRIRKIDSDFTRTNRQFKILNSIYAKFRSKSLPEQYALLYKLMPLLETDLSAAQITEYAYSALAINTQGLMHETVPYEESYATKRVNRSSVLVFDMPLNAWRVHSFIYLNEGEPEQAKLLQGGKSLPPRTPSPKLPPYAEGYEEYYNIPEPEQAPE